MDLPQIERKDYSQNYDMTEREFIFWLRGYICHENVKTLDEKKLG